MNADGFNRWFSIAANVGIVIGLILVGLQLRQNASLARIQILSDDISDERAAEMAMFGDAGAVAWAKSIEDPGSMTSAEIKVVDGWLVSQVLGWSRVALLENEGLLAAGATKQRIETSISFYFGNQFARNWWKYEKQNDYDHEFVSMVDEAIERLEDNENKIWLQNLKKDIGVRAEGDKAISSSDIPE